MKRRGFLGTLLASAAAIITGKAIAKDSEREPSPFTTIEEFHRKYPLTYEEAFKWDNPLEHPLEPKYLTGVIKHIRKISRAHYDIFFEPSDPKLVKNLQGQMVMFQCGKPAFVKDYAILGKVGEGYNDLYYKIQVLALSSRHGIHASINESIIFYANAMRESDR